MHKSDIATDPDLRAALDGIRARLDAGLAGIDPHHRLAGRPVHYRVIAGRTCEITFRDVPSVDEGELLGVKRLIGNDCFGTVSPQTAETLTVRLVVPLKAL